MDFGDNTNALFPEPNAYIQNFNKEKEQKKVVFQEPYDKLPTFYIDNDFRKGDCDCIPKPKKNDNQPHYQNPFPFDFKNIMPLLSSLGGNLGGGLNNILTSLGGAGLGNIASLFGWQNQSQTNTQNNKNTETNNENAGGLNFSNILNSLGSNGLGNIFNIFKNSSNSTSTPKTMKSSDIIIKDYKRID